MIKLKINNAVAPGDVISYQQSNHTRFATILSAHRLSTYHYYVTATPIHRRIGIPSE